MGYKVIASSQSRNWFGYADIGRAIAAVSALSLAGALAIEYIGGIPPCPLCLDQRIAYYAAVPLGLLAFAFAPYRPGWSRAVLLLLAAAFIVNAGLGVYHSGIEWKWWMGPEACSGGAGPIARTPQDLLQSLARPQVVRCDEAALRIFGISLAGYSAAISALLAALAAFSAASGRRAE
jgi:disulfide bond formation protein DsbB